MKALLAALPAALLAAIPAGAADATMGSMVTSKEWINRRAPSREEEFVGNVRYKSAGTEFTSDWALFKHDPQQWRARGRVVIKRELASGDRMTVRGDEAAYNQKSERGSIDAKELVTFERRPADGTEPDLAEAGRAQWEGRESASLIGEAHLWGPRLEGWADRADFAGGGGLVTLTGGRPVLVKREGLGDDWIGALKADAVSAERLARRVSAQGRVSGWLEFHDLPGVRK